jgi:hypothetical protein
MTFIKIINTITKPFIKNGTFRYSHHYSQDLHYLQDIHYLKSIELKTIPKDKIIINLLGDRKSVDEASWEINAFAQEKSLNTANIIYYNEILSRLIKKNNILQFIVNRCYNMSCQNVLYLNNDIINTNNYWKPYNLYVIPEATNRFNTCDFIRNCNHSNIIVYPLAASQENKRRDINILID